MTRPTPNTFKISCYSVTCSLLETGNNKTLSFNVEAKDRTRKSLPKCCRMIKAY